MGWMKLDELSTDSLLRPHMLEPLSEMHAYSVTNPKDEDEYYIIEYRPAVGFDSKISESEYSGVQGENGVFVWYVDFDESAFYSNNPNPDPDHLHIEVKEVLGGKEDYYADFKYKREKGKTEIPGVFDLKVYGDSLVCFVLTQEDGVKSCPKPKPSSIGEVRSSRQFAPVQMHVHEGLLMVQAPVPGHKRLKIADAMGVCIQDIPFEGESVQVNVSSWAKGPVLVMVEADGKRVSSRFITVR